MPGTPQEDPDRADVERVLAGDVSAFEGIVRRWQGPLVGLAYRYCRSRAVAEELAQEAFLRAFRNLGRWRHDAPFSSWLFTLAANSYRAELRRRRPPEVALDAVRPPEARGDPATLLEAKGVGETVRRLVTRLPAKYRDAVVLFYFLGQDVGAAARVLGVPAGTVKARLHRAREILRTKLTGVLHAPRAEEGL